MKVSMEVNRGYILDIVNLADKNNLVINIIFQKAIDDDKLNIKLDLLDGGSRENINKFLNDILHCNSINLLNVV